MITDNERHERAKNFRDMISVREYRIPGTGGSFVDVDDVLSELLGRRVYDSETAIDACEALGIADLIDRPTCHLVLTDIETHGNAKVRCSECGVELELISAVCNECGEEFHVPFQPQFCPNCGAEVVG